MFKRLLVLGLLAACGDDGVHHLADAPLAPDAAVDAATSGPVSLTVTFDGVPVPDLQVYFQASDGALVAKVPTNAQGVASAVMEPGGYVTTVNPFNTKRLGDDVRTFAGVKPGDQLKLHSGLGQAGILVMFTAPTDANATTYEVYSSCGTLQYLPGGGGSGGIPTATISLSASCGGTADFLIVTLDGNGQPAQYLYKPAVTVADQGTVDLSAETYVTPVPTARLQWDNVGAAYTNMSFTTIQTSTRGPMYTTGNGAQIVGGTGTATIVQPVIAGGKTIISSQPSPTNGFAQQVVLDWAPSNATVTIDLAGTGLHTYNAMPSVAPATRTVTWATDPGTAPDFAWVTVQASRTDPSTQATTYWDWQISLPYTSSTFTYPLLPAGADKFNLVTDDVASVAQLLTAKIPGGYDAVRAELLSSSGPETFAAGPTGRIQYEVLDNRVTFQETRSSWGPRRAAAALR